MRSVPQLSGLALGALATAIGCGRHAFFVRGGCMQMASALPRLRSAFGACVWEVRLLALTYQRVALGACARAAIGAARLVPRVRCHGATRSVWASGPDAQHQQLLG